jgi:hypothetical protein
MVNMVYKSYKREYITYTDLSYAKELPDRYNPQFEALDLEQRWHPITSKAHIYQTHGQIIT